MSSLTKLSTLIEEGHRKYPLMGLGRFIIIEGGEIRACAIGKAILGAGVNPHELATLTTTTVETIIKDKTGLDIRQKRVRRPAETEKLREKGKLPRLLEVILELNDALHWEAPKIVEFLRSKGL